MRRLFLISALGLSWMLSCRSLEAQFIPSSSSRVLYFAHVADGGPPVQQWRSVFRFINPRGITNLVVNGTLSFFGPQGNPLALDFGNGPVTSLQVTIPAQGATQLETTGTSAVLQTGWCWAVFDSPVLGVEEFQAWSNGAFSIGASVTGTGLNFWFETYADRFTGIAVANPYATSIYCSGTLLDANGTNLGGNTFALPSSGQVSFVLGNEISAASSAPGSYSLSCNFQPNAPINSRLAGFVALAIAGNSFEITSSMPPGGYALPTDPYRMVWNAFYQLVKALNNTSGYAVGEPQLVIAPDASSCGPNAGAINACFIPATNTVVVSLALLEILADSPSEVAQIVAHELGHAHQHLTGTTTFNSNLQLDADEFSLFGLLLTGYDAYAAGGSLGKLMMVYQASSLSTQLWENQYDPHTSFLNRIQNVMNLIQSLCALPQAASACQLEHTAFHPDAPSSLAPLLRHK